MSGLESWLPRQPSHSFRGSLLVIWKVANQSKGVEHKGKARGGIWTLALIYRLEAGVIKQPLSGTQMRNLVCNPRTRENDNVCFPVILRRDQSGPLWPTLRHCVSWWRQFYLALAKCWQQTVKVLAECLRRCWLSERSSNFSWPHRRELKEPLLKFDGWSAVRGFSERLFWY